MKIFKDWTIYEKNEHNLLKKLDYKNYSPKGYVYLLEYGTGVKIGTTKQPYVRISELSRKAENYSKTQTGAVAVSPVHSNRFENEAKLQELFSDKIVGNGELFETTMKDILNNIPEKYLAWELKEKDYGNAEHIIKMFRGNDCKFPKEKTDMPLFFCWSHEFESKLSEISQKRQIDKKKILKDTENFINKYYTFKAYKNRYEEETGETNGTLIDVCEYFPNLAKVAMTFLNKLDEKTEE